MVPYLVNIGFLQVSSLVVFTILAGIVGVFLVWRQAKEQLYNEHSIFDTILLSGIGGLIFARLGYVVLHMDIFGLSPLRVLTFWVYPGLFLYTGIIGIVLFIWLQAHKHKELEFWRLMDMYAFAFWAGSIISFFGAFLAGTEMGIESPIPHVAHPVTLYKVIIFSIFFVPYAIFRRDHDKEDIFHKTTGSIGLIILQLFLLVSFAIDFMKVRHTYYGLSDDQWVAGLLFITAACALLLRWHATRDQRMSRFSRMKEFLSRTFARQQNRWWW